MANSNKQDEMDQFMEDFLDGKYLDQKSNRVDYVQTKRVSKRSSRKSLSRPAEQWLEHDGVPPAIKIPGRQSRGASLKAEVPMDPQAVIRMLEMYAQIDDSKNAEAFLHYDKKEIDARDRRKQFTSGRKPSSRHVFRASNAAA